MCGICGRFNFDGEPVSKDRLRSMAATIEHRGPDAIGVHAEGAVGLAQARLSIIGIGPEGNPPLFNSDRSLAIVFNGEIYNFREIRERLKAKGHRFTTETDTEVVVHAYEAYGFECLREFNGMFAFAIWDRREQLIFAARDRMGQKPFFYAKTEKAFFFGSEAKAMLADPNCPCEADFGAIDCYLREGYVPSPLCAFKGMAKLRPGNFLVCKASGESRTESYWSPPYPGERGWLSSREAAREGLESLFSKAVERRLIADVPLGAFLSGGLDSGVMVAKMAELSGDRVKTFSIGFEEAGFNELPYAREVAERYGTEHQEFVVKMDAVDVLPKLVRHYNEPFADSSAIPTYYVSKMTSGHVKVALTGDGGDENFGGYPRYRKVCRFARWGHRTRCIAPALGAIRRGLREFGGGNRAARWERGLGMLTGDLPEQYRIFKSAGLKDAEKRSLYTDAFRMAIARDRGSDPMANLDYSRGDDPVAWMMRHDQNFYLPDDLQVKADIASMANSLELRSPMLDYEFVEYCARIPTAWKIRDGSGKAIFKEVFGHYLPESVLNKPKSGFRIPLGQWLRGGWKDMMCDVLLSRAATQRGLFNRDEVKRMVDEHLKGIRSWEKRLWLLLCLELWFVEFIDGSRRQS